MTSSLVCLLAASSRYFANAGLLTTAGASYNNTTTFLAALIDAHQLISEN